MQFLFEYGLFLAQAITIVIAFAAIVIINVSAASKQKGGSPSGSLELESLSDSFDDLEEMGKQALLSKDELKQHLKEEKKTKLVLVYMYLATCVARLLL